MNIKKETLEKHQLNLDRFIAKGEFDQARYLTNRYKFRGYSIGINRAVKEYKVEKEELLKIKHTEIDSRYYGAKEPTRLFLKDELNTIYNPINRAA